MRKLHPGVKVAIGPAIENGFYYDFEFPEPIRDEDLEAIEAEIHSALAEGPRLGAGGAERGGGEGALRGRGRALQGRARRHRRGADLALHAGGDFTDLCRGPHLQDSSPIKAVKLTSLAGAYWRGDERNTQLTRIYGTAFYSQADLDAHLERLDQARARDHRRLGAQLDLFHFDELSPGSPFWHPKGMAIFNALEDLRRRENARRGYVEVKTPLIYDKALWVTSGHWEKFRENMFLIPLDDEHAYAVKPMNCPGHMVLFGSTLRSYRDLPLRYAEAAPLHRNELAGALHGLTRVRYVTQDDAHIFCTREQIDSELDGCLEYLTRSLRALRDRAAGRALDAPGEQARHRRGMGLHRGRARARARAERDRVLRRSRRGVVLRPEDRPARHGCARAFVAARDDPAGRADAGTGSASRYMGADNTEHPVFVIHRALLGSFERFIGILIEHYAGAFPFWLAPVQLRLIPVADPHREAVRALKQRIEAEGFRVDVDEREETLGKRIREAEIEKIPFTIVYGDRESDESLAVRERGGGQSTRSLGELLADFRAAAATIGT